MHPREYLACHHTHRGNQTQCPVTNIFVLPYAAASSLTNNTIFTQSETTYDAVGSGRRKVTLEVEVNGTETYHIWFGIFRGWDITSATRPVGRAVVLEDDTKCCFATEGEWRTAVESGKCCSQ